MSHPLQSMHRGAANHLTLPCSLTGDITTAAAALMYTHSLSLASNNFSGDFQLGKGERKLPAFRLHPHCDSASAPVLQAMWRDRHLISGFLFVASCELTSGVSVQQLTVVPAASIHGSQGSVRASQPQGCA